ncbi:MAG TPA: GldG family protein [Burkholderiales bacterium]|nr:GldG family protein [Burkholderiales bacterium]
MDRSFRYLLILLAGIALISTAAAIHALLVEPMVWTALLGVPGAALSLWGAFALRSELGALAGKRRGEIALYTLGAIGVLLAIAYFSVRFPLRLDMTTQGLFSLSDQTKQMLKRLDKPVHITFFHDPMMRETVELYQLMAAQTDKITGEFYDPMLNPAQARMRGVEFAGTAIMESEGRRLTINSPSETDIANGILRVSQGVQQVVCFLDGHAEPDPFSLESHDHMEGTAGHTHGLGSRVDIHERHGMAKARHGLEAMNYVVEKISLMKGGSTLSRCAVLVVAGPKVPLAPSELKAIDHYLATGGNALFMLDPFIVTGLEPVIRAFGVVLDNDIVIDEGSHFWTDVSAPAVTDYNRFDITQDLPLTFFPGARSLSPTPQPVPGNSVRPLINSSKESFGQTNRDRVDFEPGKSIAGPCTLMVIVNRRPEFVASTEAVLRQLQGKHAVQEPGAEGSTPPKPTTHSRIAVIGDSDFATNSFYHIMGNGKLFLNTINYLASQENLIGIAPRTYDLPRVNLTNRQMKGTFILSIVLIPALMALVGIAVWWRQR